MDPWPATFVKEWQEVLPLQVIELLLHPRLKRNHSFPKDFAPNRLWNPIGMRTNAGFLPQKPGGIRKQLVSNRVSLFGVPFGPEAPLQIIILLSRKRGLGRQPLRHEPFKVGPQLI